MNFTVAFLLGLFDGIIGTGAFVTVFLFVCWLLGA
jgi:hypothetical protein